MSLTGTQSEVVKKLPAVRRRATRVSEEELVVKEYLPGRGLLPLLVSPAVAGVDLKAWVANNRGELAAELQRCGAVLFRGFDVKSASEFEHFIKVVSAGGALEYRERSSPRSQVQGNVYTSTDYPAEQSIFPHNENSYQQTWPLKIFFYCQTPSERGGETPLVDTRGLYGRISPEVRARFEEKQVMYVRNYGGGFGLDWQTVFQTTDRSEVEQYCRRSGIEFEWKEGGRLRTRHVRPAVTRHPVTGDKVWFNHATFFHVSTLAPAIRDGLLAEFAPEDLPNNTFYGDGTEIEPDVLEHLREAYLEESVTFAWERGDVVLIDNMLTSHARRPYSGPRKIVFGMAEPYTRTDI